MPSSYFAGQVMCKNGAGLTGAQKQARERMRSLSRNGASIVAANTVREGAAQRQDSLRTGLMNLGRSAQGQGLQGINSAGIGAALIP